MKFSFCAYPLFFCTILFFSCARVSVQDDVVSPPRPEKNFQFKAETEGIDDPEIDRMCFYKIYINKIEEGRTTTGLESQIKVFDAGLPANRHLLKVEKWVIDRQSERYIKLNNVEQPRPDFIYFTIEEGKRTVVEMKTHISGYTGFNVSYD